MRSSKFVSVDTKTNASSYIIIYLYGIHGIISDRVYRGITDDTAARTHAHSVML